MMDYLVENPGTVFELTLQHLRMTGIAVLLAAAIALPLGALVTYQSWLRLPVLGFLSTLYTIPSLALIVLLLPLFGLNANSAIAAMAIYNQAILVRNVTVALSDLDPAILEAARGMGMNLWQRWWRIQMPLILPVFLAGVRLATVVSISIGTIAALFAGGGLGELLFEGVTQDRPDKIWAGAIAVASLALLLNSGLRRLERWAGPQSRAARR